MPRLRPPPRHGPRHAAADLARLAVADAARREWTEAHAGLAARAEAAERELRSRGLAGRIPVTDAEVAEASAEPRESPPIDPDLRAQWKAEQAAEREAYRQAEAERWADRIPVTDAELERTRAKDAERAEAEATAEAEADAPATERETTEPQSSASWWQQYHAGHPEFSRRDRHAGAEKDGRPGVSPERAADEADLAEARAELERVGELIDRIPDRAAERRAEMTQAGIDEPVGHEPQAEPELESSWQPGAARGYQEPAAAADAEAEMEIG